MIESENKCLRRIRRKKCSKICLVPTCLKEIEKLLYYCSHFQGF